MSFDLRFCAQRGPDLEAALLERLLDLRLRNVSLKPSTDPADDRRKFQAWLSRSTTVAWCEDPSGTPCALASWRIFDWSYRGKARRGCAVEYLFIDQAFRGSLGITLSMVRVFLRLCLDAGTASLWVGGGAGYLPGSVAMGRYVGPVHFLNDPGTDEEARTFLELAAREAGVGVGTDGLVAMRTLPAAPSPGWHRRNCGEETYRRYLELNPRWLEGFGLISGSRVTAASLGRIVGSAARRLLRLRPQRAAAPGWS